MSMKIELSADLPIEHCHQCNKGNIYQADWLNGKRDKTVKFNSHTSGLECVAFHGEYKILVSEEYGKNYQTEETKVKQVAPL